jgi:hypothetical protein
MEVLLAGCTGSDFVEPGLVEWSCFTARCEVGGRELKIDVATYSWR